MTDPKRSWLAQVALEHDWSLDEIVDLSNDKKTAEMNDDSPEGQQKIVDDLDKKIRTYKAQLEKLAKREGQRNRSAISNLASS